MATQDAVAGRFETHHGGDAMICSCLLPSRGRPFSLFTLIHTLNHSGNRANFEILIRLDDDDAKTLNYRATFEQFTNVKLVVGPRHGYTGYPKSCAELARVARGKWCWFLTDDCIVGGRDFDKQLEAMPTTGFVVEPEISRLGGSIYYKQEGSNFPCIPNGSWGDDWGALYDTGIDQLLRKKMGWQTKFLDGVTAWHLQD